MTHADSGPGPADIQLQIHDLVAIQPDQLKATVRCLRGPVYLHARFHHTNRTDAIELKLSGIMIYNRMVQQLDPAWTALVTLTGRGTNLVNPGDTINGNNPEDVSSRNPIHNS
jgi:hypothetical protein